MSHRKIDTGELDDTEGNMPLRKVADGAETGADAEGNGRRLPPAPSVSDGDDTEGNAARGKG